MKPRTKKVIRIVLIIILLLLMAYHLSKDKVRKYIIDDEDKVEIVK